MIHNSKRFRWQFNTETDSAMSRKQHPDDDKPLSIEQARGKFAKAISDLLAGSDPGTISFRLKPTKKRGELYSLKLTQQQRESVIQLAPINGKLLKKLKDAGEGTQIVDVTRNELSQLNDATGQAAVDARSPHKQRLNAVQRKVTDLFAEDHAGLFGETTPKTRNSSPRKSDLIYQFKITLSDIKPAIWRRIQVQDCTLDKLHEHIQTAMGWTNSHLHQFEIQGERYGDPELLDDGFDEFDGVDSTKTMISDIVPKNAQRFVIKYEYDFGDGWEHKVLFEGCPLVDKGKKSPICLEGKRACPPEDVGGVGGYYDFLAAITDPKHEEHESLLEWCGGSFSPDEFDPTKATKAMKKGLPDWRNE